MPTPPTAHTEENRPLVVGLGGTTRAPSTTERALRAALEAAERAGARTLCFGGSELELPLYAPERADHGTASAMLASIARADAVILASPGYHGSISGLMKNAIDYIENLREDRRPYLDGRPVGCIACAYGWQAAVTTLTSLRTIVHALRGWPTPLGVALNSSQRLFDDDGIADETVRSQLELVGEQVVDFARMRSTSECSRQPVAVGPP